MFLNSSALVNISSLLNETLMSNWVDDSLPPTTTVNRYHRLGEMSPLLPFGMVLIISTVIFILIVFRRWPGLAAGIVAGCLTSISIYMLLVALKEQRVVLE